MISVRLTFLGEKDIVFHGVAVDPPGVGKPFTLLLPNDKVAVTGVVKLVDLDTFETETGARYVWAREVGDA